MTLRVGPSMCTQEGQINRYTGHKVSFRLWGSRLWAPGAGSCPVVG